MADKLDNYFFLGFLCKTYLYGLVALVADGTSSRGPRAIVASITGFLSPIKGRGLGV